MRDWYRSAVGYLSIPGGRRAGSETRQRRARGSAANEATRCNLAIKLKRISALTTKLWVHIEKTSSGFQGKVRTPQPKDQTLTACIAVICAFAAMGTLATNIFLPSLPTMAADLHVSSAVVTSTISVFLAIFAVGQLIVGPLSDRFGRRIPILAGLCIFVAGTIWCAFAGDLSNLLVGRSIQAVGACTAMVLSRAIARDLFEGQALAKAMALTTIANAAAPGFSPLVGSALDHFFGWRSEFVFVAIFAICALLAYATLIGETNSSANGSVNPLAVGGSYLGLIRDARFVAPTRTASLLVAGLFAVFSAAPRVLLEHFGFSPVTLGLLFAGVVVLVFGASMLAPRLSARLGLYRAMLVGLGSTAIGAVALLLAVLVANNAFLPFLFTTAIFLFGVGIASPLSSAAALSPFGNKAGVAAALFGFAQMAGAACGALLAAVVSNDPALGLAIVLALASPLAMILHGRAGRSSGFCDKPIRL
jgi:MFS transporter, DHA1 family, multidrug resistance protein